MAVPQDKTALLAAINSEFSKLCREFAQVPAALVDEQSLPGHAKDTLMSVNNLAAYLLGWNELVLKWLARDAVGQPIDFPETGFKWNELGRLAQKFYRDYDALPFTQVIERLIAAQAQIVAHINTSSNEQLYGQAWYGKWTQGRMIQFNTASPYSNARGRLRKWRKGQGY
ncbi:ClbS/DfsB family four-helix bundle protein [Candidatus Symbiopectobacterium sp. NZEC135]|uniref:ClbS/DfsB family four-helix bundle protein n=1 Tax=Candidatus Symbiopectobacterium sp. NZEC135 TaxID=2820471 RepID=UPI002227F310|nr:ClbS/DfsB family four-helix bundle protein [Candidatus Symbiopectobacterium sp. NZEC135]MCW2479368.1 ClbS/DfsB family four-helix bundle protein [Candidatus Symbiopectobacterium sp. NZEC135]